jgi:Glycosyl-4,4'-diaponeurosporenoate acyltransferase
MAVLLVYCWIVRGPNHPVYGLLVVSWTLVLGPLLAVPMMSRVPRGWHRVSARERVLHDLLGVSAFRKLLQYSGWEHHVHKRNFHATTAGLRPLELALQSNASAHGSCFVIHLLIACVCLFAGHWWGALWILLPALFVHLYPLLLQRSIMLRLQPLLDKLPTVNAGGTKPNKAVNPSGGSGGF